jgi:hypothetical protein
MFTKLFHRRWHRYHFLVFLCFPTCFRSFSLYLTLQYHGTLLMTPVLTVRRKYRCVFDKSICNSSLSLFIKVVHSPTRTHFSTMYCNWRP